MSCREIWLVRHGETPANKDGIVQGGIDVPLNELGEAQARALAAWLAARPVKPDAIIASPLVRARRTAEILGEALALELELEPRLKERTFGAWEGRSFADILQSWEGPGDAWDARPPEGESPADLLARAGAAFDEIGARDDLGERVMLVAHGGTIGALSCRAMGLEFNSINVRRFRRDNTGLTILRRSRKAASGFAVDVLNATFHLDGLATDLG